MPPLPEAPRGPRIAPVSKGVVGRLAQMAGVLTVLWAGALLLLAWQRPEWEGPASSAIGFAWRALINLTWIGFGVAVIRRQRFSTFLLFFVHAASAALLTTFSLLPGRYGFSMEWLAWAMYVWVPALCAGMLLPDVIWRWRQPLRDDELD